MTDPWDTLEHARDTTLRLAHEAILLGHRSFWCDVRSLQISTGRLHAEVFELGLESDSFHARSLSPKRIAPGAAFWKLLHQIHYRVDPPVNSGYWHPLQMLCGSVNQARIVNPPQALFQVNEKMAPLFEKGLSAPSLISSHWKSLSAFGMKEGKTVLKPLDEAQSRGVSLLDWKTSTLPQNKRILSQLTSRFERPVLLQRYLPRIQDGERRFWFIDGKPLAHAIKMPLKGDFRVNIDGGSRLMERSLTAWEKNQAQKISRLLRRLGIRLAAVDLIQGWVSDFNVTSPGLIVEMESLLGENLARPILNGLVSNPD